MNPFWLTPSLHSSKPYGIFSWLREGRLPVSSSQLHALAFSTDYRESAASSHVQSRGRTDVISMVIYNNLTFILTILLILDFTFVRIATFSGFSVAIYRHSFNDINNRV